MEQPNTIHFFRTRPDDLAMEQVHQYAQRIPCEYKRKRSVESPPNEGYRRLLYLDRPDDNYETRLHLERLANRLERSESEIRRLKDKFDLQEEFDAIVQGSTPLFAIHDVVRIFIEACDKQTKDCIQRYPNLTKAFQSKAKRQPDGPYRWLVEQLKIESRHNTRSGTTGEAAKCVEDVHGKLVPGAQLTSDVDSMLFFLDLYKNAKEERDRAGHPCSHPLGDVSRTLTFVKKRMKDGKLPEPYKSTSGQKLLEAAITHLDNLQNKKSQLEVAGPSG
ncbi:unnamed protein product [Sphagnum jensenii]|uniref:Uncharacterized protein n=1 Tax=Sphagnum jensenii TaxID=128206 RepID=A0ABP1BFS0_9BRYO